MWTAISISWGSLSAIPISNFPITAAVQSSQPRRLSAQPQNNNAAASSDGDTILFKSNLNQEEAGDGRQLSGSDVLWALQRAAAQKKKKKRTSGNKKKKKRGSSSMDGNKEGSAEDSSDYSKVKPLCIKDDWGSRLDDLETRLQELSDI